MNRIALAVFPLMLAVAFAGCGKSDGSAELSAGREALAAGDYARAAEVFAKGCECDQTNPDVWLELARARLKLGELPLAREAAVKALELAGGDYDVVMFAAQIEYHLKNYDEAMKGFRAVADDEKLPANVRSAAWSAIGVVTMSRSEQDLHQARIAYLRALRLDHRNAAAWYNLGCLYRDAFDFKEAALDQLERFVRLEQTADVRVQRVQRSFIPELREAIARTAAQRAGAAVRNESLCASELQKAKAAAAKKAWETAAKHYAAALKADVNSYPAALGVAEMLEKTSKNTARDAQRILEAYLAACRLNPKAVSLYLRTGDLAAKNSNHASAAAIFSRAVAADPANITAIDGLIRALGKIGDRRNARAYQAYRDTIPVRRAVKR